MSSLSLALEEINCPHCDSARSAVWARENGYVLKRCLQCSLLFVNPRPSENSINEANKLGVHKGEEASLNVEYRRDPRKVAHYAAILSEMFAAEISSKKPVRWLDIGAGYGELVEAVIEAMPSGSTAIGIEPMLPKVKVAQELGLPISDAKLSDVDGPFEVISLINVYSHIPDFHSFAEQIVRKLAPGGKLFIETGNLADLNTVDEFGDILFLPDHLVFAGEAHIVEEMRRLGLTVEKSKKQPIDDIIWCSKMFIKNIIKRRKLFIAMPGTSRFRTIFYKAGLQS